jgi:hypothetical protein
MESKVKHFMYVPWTGLGLFGGFRGNRWLRNRIKVFKQFVMPSLLVQTNKNFTLWCSWRPEERHNKHVKELVEYLNGIPGLRTVHTFYGVCFWDDKYSDEEARSRLLSSLHGSIGELLDEIGECDSVLMTIQPSDDCYRRDTVEGLQEFFEQHPNTQAVGFEKGYMMNYLTGELAEYNPKTNPPFFTIKFPREIFIDPLKHAEYTGPYKSHEYIGDKLQYETLNERGFIVGTHGENISTTYVHPYRGSSVNKQILLLFGLENIEPLKIRTSIRRAILRRLPHRVQRKLRYYLGEILWQGLYNFLRN